MPGTCDSKKEPAYYAIAIEAGFTTLISGYVTARVPLKGSSCVLP